MMHDALRHGWLRRLHHDQRTETGEQLAGRIRRFQGNLRRELAAGPGEDVLTGPLLP